MSKKKNYNKYVRKGNPLKDKITLGDNSVMVRANQYRDELFLYFCKAIYDKEDANDLVQHAIIRAGRYLNLDDDDKTFKKKLFIIATETLFWYFERKKKDIFSYTTYEYKQDEEDSYDKVQFIIIPNEYSPEGINYSLIFEKIKSKLNSRQRMMLDLMLEGYGTEDIMRIMGYKNRSVVVATRSAMLRKVRQMLKEMGFVIKNGN